MSRHEVELTVNGERCFVNVEPRRHLADALREDIGLTGTHLGCEQGVCGACTIMIDGRPERSCLNLAVSCNERIIQTIEGFKNDPLMAALRANFSAYHALQCGYCTPGMLITGYDIVKRLPDADETRIRNELAGNLCRCTGYVGIVEAIAATLREFGPGHPWRQAVQEVTSEVAVVPAMVPVDANAAVSIKPSLKATLPNDTTGIGRSVDFDMTPDDLWRRLCDVEAIAKCLPGFTLGEIHEPAGGSQRIVGQMTVALGPIKTRFEGEAAISFDHQTKKGQVQGRGQDQKSRSAGQGEIVFSVQPDGGGSRLVINVRHEVTGPLAQFSRGAVVSDLIAMLLDQFAANLKTMATGGKVASSQQVNAGGIGWAWITQKIRAWLGAGPRTPQP